MPFRRPHLRDLAPAPALTLAVLLLADAVGLLLFYLWFYRSALDAFFHPTDLGPVKPLARLALGAILILLVAVVQVIALRAWYRR